MALYSARQKSGDNYELTLIIFVFHKGVGGLLNKSTKYLHEKQMRTFYTYQNKENSM